MNIYWIDVEGGAATLVVSPSGESMLVDTGFAVGPEGAKTPFREQTGDHDRDAKRIYAVAQQAGLKKIDYVVISHYHLDHVGGLFALAKLIPIGVAKALRRRIDEWCATYRSSSFSPRATPAARLRNSADSTAVAAHSTNRSPRIFTGSAFARTNSLDTR